MTIRYVFTNVISFSFKPDVFSFLPVKWQEFQMVNPKFSQFILFINCSINEFLNHKLWRCMDNQNIVWKGKNGINWCIFCMLKFDINGLCFIAEHNKLNRNSWGSNVLFNKSIMYELVQVQTQDWKAKWHNCFFNFK